MNWKRLGIVGGVALAATTFSAPADAQTSTGRRNTSTEVQIVVGPSTAPRSPRVVAPTSKRNRGYVWPRGRGYYYGGWGYPDDGYPFGYGPWSYHKGYPYPGSPAAQYYDRFYDVHQRGR